MKKLRFLASMVAMVIGVSSAFGQMPGAPPSGSEESEQGQFDFSVELDRSLVAIDLTTAEVELQPQFGVLENTAEGITYVPDFATGMDSFVFVADHAIFEVPVTFFGSVVDGFVSLRYEYSTDEKKDDDAGNGESDDDGTVTVDDDSGTTVTGTILQGPGTSIDFPEGTVVIGTDDSVDNDIAIIDSGEGDEIHTHDDVGSLDEVRDILENYPDGSIPAIVFVGHGAGGGVQLGGGGDNLDGDTLSEDEHQDLVDLINEKLDEDAKIYILGCDQFDEDDAQHIQDLANETGHPVVANEDPVVFVERPWWWDYFYGEGNWVEVTPEDGDGGDAPEGP